MSKNGPALNFPNLLSFARLALLPVFLLLVSGETPAARWAAIGLGLFGIASDVLDGYLARRWNQVTELGKILDPLSDKIIIAAIAVFAVLEKNCPLWLGGLILGRDAAILIFGLVWKNRLDFIPTSNLVGKLSALITALALLAYVFDSRSAARILTPAAMGMILLSSAVYTRRFLAQLGRAATVGPGGSRA